MSILDLKVDVHSKPHLLKSTSSKSGSQQPTDENLTMISTISSGMDGDEAGADSIEVGNEKKKKTAKNEDVVIVVDETPGHGTILSENSPAKAVIPESKGTRISSGGRRSSVEGGAGKSQKRKNSAGVADKTSITEQHSQVRK